MFAVSTWNRWSPPGKCYLPAAKPAIKVKEREWIFYHIRVPLDFKRNFGSFILLEYLNHETRKCSMCLCVMWSVTAKTMFLEAGGWVFFRRAIPCRSHPQGLWNYRGESLPDTPREVHLRIAHTSCWHGCFQLSSMQNRPSTVSLTHVLAGIAKCKNGQKII